MIRSYSWHILYVNGSLTSQNSRNRELVNIRSIYGMIKRRTFIAFCSGLAASSIAAGHTLRNPVAVIESKPKFIGTPLPAFSSSKPILDKKFTPSITDLQPDYAVVDNIKPPSERQSETQLDIVLNENQRMVASSVLARFTQIQKHVGYGNFNIIGWDQSLRIARHRNKIGAFTAAELDFIEDLFWINTDLLGFYGDKVITGLSTTILIKDIVKIPGSGHYLFKGAAADTYQKIRKDVGNSIVLTSGIRNVVKQLYLFLGKTAKVGCNLSLASNSVAPPGHSYHALGDFDVGKNGFGEKNFSKKFALTEEFKRLSDLGYVNIRYPQNNPFGIRYEPWHIKVV